MPLTAQQLIYELQTAIVKNPEAAKWLVHYLGVCEDEDDDGNLDYCEDEKAVSKVRAADNCFKIE